MDYKMDYKMEKLNKLANAITNAPNLKAEKVCIAHGQLQ